MFEEPRDRRRTLRDAALFALLLALPWHGAQAAPAAAPTPAATARAESTTFTVRPPVVTRHHGHFNGRDVAFTATVEGLDVDDDKGHRGAHLVSVAYTADAVAGRDVVAARRPVLFLFNGGPIVASVYLHMGSFGPMRVFFPDDPAASPFSYALEDNPYSLLDVADLVFIDPAGTGFSRVAPGKNAADYHSVVGDGQQVAAFMAAWLRRHGRLASPKFVLGESYGTMRAVEVGHQLAHLPQPILLDGIVLCGEAVNIVEYSQRPRNILSYVLSLPTLAATAWHFQKVDRRGQTLEQFIQSARAFARDEYLGALYRGNTLSDGERARIAKGLEEYSGIPAAYYVAHDLRITKETYRAELFKDKGLLLGRNDSRYTARITDKGNGPDPSSILAEALEKVFVGYLRDTLRVDWKEPYVFREVSRGFEGWGWGGTTPFSDWPYVDLVSELMQKNPRFRVMLSHGYYDTQTTMGAAEYAATQSGWPRDRTWVREYPGGHMDYSIDATAQALSQDLRAFMSGAH